MHVMLLAHRLMLDTTVPNQPSNQVTKDYLRTGKLPVATDGSLFSVYRPGMKLKAVKNPYEVATGAVAGDIDRGL